MENIIPESDLVHFRQQCWYKQDILKVESKTATDYDQRSAVINTDLHVVRPP